MLCSAFDSFGRASIEAADATELGGTRSPLLFILQRLLTQPKSTGTNTA